MDGILLIRKSQGMTSHDVVDRLRRAVGMKRIGHAGTLDPDARGLLVLCLGKATKVSALVAAADKTYCVGFRLGVETDTYDAGGKVVAEKPADVKEEVLREILARFVGTHPQKPPLFSAVKVRGRKLYEYARKGEEVEIPVREVHIASIGLRRYACPGGELEVSCSKGTYVRSLIHDIGRRLGTGAITTDIERVACGRLRVEQGVTLESIESSADPAQEAARRLLSIPEGLGDLPSLRVSHRILPRVLHGAGLGPAEMADCRWETPAAGPAASVLLLKEDGEALALGAYDGRARIHVRRVL